MTDLDDIYSRQPADDEEMWRIRIDGGDLSYPGVNRQRADKVSSGRLVVWWDEPTGHHYPYQAPPPPEIVEPVWCSRVGRNVYSIPLRPTDVKPEYLDELGTWASEIEGWPHEYRYDFGTKPLDLENVWVPRDVWLRWKAEQ